MSNTAERAKARRETWRGGVAESFEELERIDFEHWTAMTPADRLKLMWSLVEDTLALKGEHGPAPRLQRSIGGIRPLEG